MLADMLQDPSGGKCIRVGIVVQKNYQTFSTGDAEKLPDVFHWR